MIQKIKSFGLDGINGYAVDVEVDLARGLPSFTLVGLPDASVKESKERVQSAIKNSGYKIAAGKITVNLAPAEMRKEGSLYDLAIAMGILMAMEEDLTIIDKDGKSSKVPQRPWQSMKTTAFIGELGLDGELHGVAGVLPMLLSAKSCGIHVVVVPESNKFEAAFVEGIEVYAAKNFRDVMDWTDGMPTLEFVEKTSFESIKINQTFTEDLKYVKGQYIAKRALEISAAGGHNLLFIGSPGSGKTMLARCMPSIMPDMTVEECFEVTKLHSISGTLYNENNLGVVVKRPFRSPHHTASRIALTGGGTSATAGEISLAHNGVLFLDELPEYPRSCLEALRQPLEDNFITISRARANVKYPASFTLIASMNPCPCGFYGSRTNKCNCSVSAREKYLRKLSGPLMDRIDLHVEVDNVTYDDLRAADGAEPSAKVKERVESARAVQRARQGAVCNAKLNSAQIKEFCKIGEEAERIMKAAFERLNLSARAFSRILKVARTIADLENSNDIKTEHITEALGYRSLDKKYNL
jgi:magnesium chelatase family protein